MSNPTRPKNAGFDVTHDRSLLLEVSGDVGIATLNRPHRINALDLNLVSQLMTALTLWRSDPAVKLVVLRGAGDRGFCAGGDLRSDGASEGEGDHHFLRAEYALDFLIATYPKPVVALMDGIVMGGGFGLAGHASHRIVTERSRLAMPETKIGLTPDAGMSYHLARVRHGWGMHWALTSSTMDAADALFCGLADDYVPHSALDSLVSALSARGESTVQDVINRFASPAPAATVAEQSVMAEYWYNADSVEDMLNRLDASSSGTAISAAEKIRVASPFAVKATFSAIRSAADLDLWGCLQQEFRYMVGLSARSDLAEGVTATLLEKRAARWEPRNLADVSEESLRDIANFPVDLGAEPRHSPTPSQQSSP
ncbi:MULTISPECIES: enoyl-CoA hydratase/isomerase family protein [unclassified Salinibacterium]|uniref:enoyl-CoA hydratase/isomerase family protein n=1 Tax=unclassified Salinibacterium TaxID=2632331 RepID=UPI001E358A75|nr:MULTISPECIES: enoyl-CoA hydratase/isomerase family protein [unclassified Salinibacterium]